jgi:hypothetical protein
LNHKPFQLEDEVLRGPTGLQHVTKVSLIFAVNSTLRGKTGFCSDCKSKPPRPYKLHA